MSGELRRFLELLESGVEFRYTVMAYLGVMEVLKRLDAIGEEQVRLREDFNKLGEEQVKLREDFNELREEQVRLRGDFNRLQQYAPISRSGGWEAS